MARLEKFFVIACSPPLLSKFAKSAHARTEDMPVTTACSSRSHASNSQSALSEIAGIPL